MRKLLIVLMVLVCGVLQAQELYLSDGAIKLAYYRYLPTQYYYGTSDPASGGVWPFELDGALNTDTSPISYKMPVRGEGDYQSNDIWFHFGKAGDSGKITGEDKKFGKYSAKISGKEAAIQPNNIPMFDYFQLEFWFKIANLSTTDSGRQQLFRFYRGYGSYYFMTQFVLADIPVAKIATMTFETRIVGPSGTKIVETATYTISLDAWHFFSLNKQPIGVGQSWIFTGVDGVIDSQVIGYQSISFLATSSFSLGRFDGSTRTYDLYVDELSFFKDYTHSLTGYVQTADSTNINGGKILIGGE